MFNEVFFQGLYNLGEHKDKFVFGVEVLDVPPFKSDDTHCLGALMMTREQVEWLWLIIEHAEEHDLFTREGLARNHHLVNSLKDLKKMFDGVNFEKR